MLTKSDILLFNRIKDVSYEEPNGLKKFLNLVKYHTKKSNFKFSFSNGNGSLHHNITVRENLDLEAIPTSISLNTKLKTKDIIANIENEYLQKLISRICPLERTPGQLNQEELKLASIIKGVIAQTDFIFLDSPGKGLSQTNLSLVKKCLTYEAKVNSRIIIISAQDQSKWIDVANKLITKNSNEYQIETNKMLINYEEVSIRPVLKIA